MSTSELLAAVEENPSDYKAFETLIKHLVSEGDQDGLESVYERVPGWAPGDPQSALLRVLSQVARVTKDEPMSSFLNYRNGLLFWKGYDEPQKAEMSFRKVEVPPSDATLLRAFYLDFYVAQNNWRRLEQFLSDPSKGGMEDPVEVKRLLGRLALERDQADKAVGFWQGVRAADPQDAEAEGHLRKLYVAVGKWLSLIDLLKENLDALPTTPDTLEERIGLLLEMIDIYKNQMNAASKVVATWQQVLDIDPGNAQALDALAAEYTEMNRWPDLVKVLQQKVEHEQDPDNLIDLHREIASIMMERFSNTTEAIRSYESILELDPENDEAIRVLKEIYEGRRDWDNYILIAEREIGLMTDGAAKQEQFIELARLASERIRRPQTPIALWERVLNFDESHSEALEQLESLYEREKNFKSLASILEKRAELAVGHEEAITLLDKLGMVVSVRLHDPERATEVWKRILEFDPEHRKAQAELKKRFTGEHDWESLEWFFRTYGNVSDWVRTLESQAKSVDDDAERTELLFKAAAVWQDELDDQRRAVKNLESVLELTPDHAGAARMLIPIYHELANHRALPPVYDIALEATDDIGERRALLLAQAEVQEKHLGAPDAAFFAYVQAVSEAPNAVELHGELKRLAEASQNWESYAFVLQEAVEQVEGEADKIGVLLEIGRVFRDFLGAPDTALSFFNRVLQLDEYNRDALAAAEAAWRETGAHDQLILVYEKQLAIALDAAERQAILFNLVAVWRDQVGAPDEAEAILREMLLDFPDETRVHEELVAILLAQRRFADLREVLELERDVLLSRGAPGVVLADLECELGMLSYGTRGRKDGVDRVVDHYEAALGHHPNHRGTVERLEELLADASERLRITHLLEPVYEASADWSRLAQVLEIQLVGAQADQDQPRQVALLERLATLYRDHLGDQDLAWRSYARRFELQPEHAPVRSELQKLTAPLDRWRPFVGLYTAHADEPLDKPSRLAIKLEIARTWHRRLDSLEDARVFYHKVLDEEPEQKDALEALEEIYVALDRAEDLLGIYRRKIELTDDTEQKLDYLYRTSDLLRDRLDAPDDAVLAAREALDLVPGHLPTIQRLDELYTLTGRWEDLAATLDDTLGLVEGDLERTVVLRVRLAGVNERHLEQPSRAIAIYASVLELAPDNAATIEALERLFTDDALAPDIAPILQPFYDRHGDWQRLIEVYTVREAVAGDVAEKVDWHYKIAELYEHLGEQPDSAFHHFELAAAIDPGNEQTVDELLRLADSLDNHGELFHVLQQVVEDVPDDARRIETHRIIAHLARDKTRDVSGAERHLRAILELDAVDRPAIEALIALYRETADADKLVEMLLHKAPLEDDFTTRQELYAEAGSISAELLDKPEQAIEIYETLHGLDPNQTRALDALEQLYAQTENWDELVRVYREKIDRSADLDTRKGYAALMGVVQSDRLDAPHDAIGTWRRIFEWDATDLDALDRLDGLYTKLEDWFNLEDVLRRKQELVDDAGWQAAQLRVARLYESDERLGDVLRAIEAYALLLDRNPDHAEALDALKAILATRDAYEQAFKALAPVLEARGAHEDLWAQYEVLAGHQSDDPYRKVGTLHEMALLAELQLADPERALDAQARAFALDPRHETTTAELERLAEDNGFWEELAAIYGQGAADADDDMLALGLRLKVGAILMDRIGSSERAIESYRAVYEDFPEHGEVLDRLHRLYEQAAMATELAEIIRHQADVAHETPVKVALLEKLARVSEEALEDPAAACEAYGEILDLERHAPLAVAELRRLFEAGVKRLDIAERLDPIYREQEAWDELETLLQLRLEALEDPIDQMESMREIARINLECQERPAVALLWFGRAFRLDPEDDGLLVQLRTLAEETDGWGDLLRILMEAAAACEDVERRVHLWHGAAETARDRLGDLEEAERIFRLILTEDEANLRALQALDAMLLAAERWEDLEPVLVAQAANDDVFDDERMKLYVRLAELYRDRLSDRARSVAAWREVLELNDMHEPALKALQSIYAEDDRWQDLYEVLQRLFDIARSEEERVAYASDMATIAESALEQPDKAIEHWEEVLIIAPQDQSAVRELQRLLGDLEQWPALVEAYDRELRMDVADGARRLELHRLSGRLWQERLDDPFQAQVSWQRAREEDAHDREALDALRGIHAESGNDNALAEIIEAAIASGHYAPEEELALWRQLAVIRTEVFMARSEAIEAWRAVLSLAATDAEAIAALERLYEGEGRWEDAVDLYRLKLTTIADEEERLGTWLALAAIQHDNLGAIDEAISTYTEILGHAPGNLEASRRLDAIYERTEQWEPLTQLLLTRNDHLDEAEDRLLNLQRLAVIYEQRLGQPDMAFLVLQRASEEVPEEGQVIAELERLAGDTGLWADLYEVYEATLPHLEGEAAVDVMLKSARVQHERVGAPAQAIALYDRVLEHVEDHEPALRSLVELNGAEQRWEALARNLDTLAEVTPDYLEKPALLKRLARLYEVELAQPAQAVATWHRVLDVDEIDREALEALEALHIASGEWEPLIDVYERMVSVDPAQETDLRLKIAGILEVHLGRVDDAIGVYDELLSYDPGNEVALGRLEALYGEREDWTHLVDVYDRAFSAAQSDEGRVEMARKIAILQEAAFADAEAAARSYQDILLISPLDEEAFLALERIYTEQETWHELVVLYNQRYDNAESSDARADALSSLASVYRDRLEDVDNAIQAFQGVLLERRADKEALDALEAMYRGLELWDNVLQTLDHKLEVETDPERRVALLCARGELAARELRDSFRAADSYQLVLKEQPGYKPAVEALVRIYKGEGRHDKVVETLKHRLEVSDSDVERADLHVDIAEAFAKHLGQPKEALDHLEAAAGLDPESRRALWSLAQLYMNAEEHTKAMPLLDLLVDKLSEETDREQLFKVRKHLGLCAEQVAQYEQAIEELERAAGLMAPDRETVEALARLHFKKRNYAEAERYLKQVIDTYKGDLSSSEYVNLYLQLGESALKLGHIDHAQTYLQLVVEHEPHNVSALEQIVVVLQAHDDWETAVRYMEELLQIQGDELKRYKIQLEIGDVLNQKLGAPDKAAAAYRAALDMGIFPKEPALKLVELSAASKEYGEVIRYLNHLIKLEEDPKRRAHFAYLAAVTYRDELQDPSQAIKYFNLALDCHFEDVSRLKAGEDLQAFQLIDILLTQARQWKPLEQNYRRMLDRVQKAKDAWPEAAALQFLLYKNLGEIYRSRLMRRDYAIIAFDLARKLRPEDETIREILASLYEVSETAAELKKAIDHHRFLIEQRPNRYESYRRLADLFKKVGEPDASWCVAGLLTTLDQANEAEKRFYLSYVPASMAEPRRIIDHTIWMQGIMSRGEDPDVGHMFELIYAGLGKGLGDKQLKSFGLKKKNRIGYEEGLLVSNTVRSVARMFGTNPPELYRWPEPSGIEILPTNPPALRFGTDTMSGRDDKELAFIVAKRLSYLHPWHLITTIYGRDALDHLYMAAGSLVNPNFTLTLREDIPSEARQAIAQNVGELRAILEKNIAPDIRQQLTAVMQNMWRRTPNPDIGRWHRQIELTANHAGLVAAGDIELVGQLIKNEAVGMSKLKSSEKLKEFVKYVISEPYLQLRRHLGVQIDYSELIG